MKKLFLILIVSTVLCCLFALGISAESKITEPTHIYHIVSDEQSELALSLKSQGKEVIVLANIYSSTSVLSDTDWISQFNDGDHIEFIFEESIVEPIENNVGILINKAITLTIRYNGYSHLITSTNNKENFLVVKHSGAQINLIGDSQIYDENGNVIKNFSYNPNDLSKNTVQIRHSKVYCWVYDGNLYAENITSRTGQEFVYTTDDNSSTDPSVRNTYEFIDCSLTSTHWALGLDGRATSEKIVKISGGYCSNFLAYTCCNGSFIENCVIDSFDMDSWSITNQMIVFSNVTINGKISSATGRTHLTFIDCKFDLNKLSLGSDGAGSQYALVYTSVNCENDGTLNVYKQGNGTTPVNNDSKYAQLVIDFYNDEGNKSKGHEIVFSKTYVGAKYFSDCIFTQSCKSCGFISSQETVSALFYSLGFSTPEFDTAYSVVLGFLTHQDAIEAYCAKSNTVINFGFAVALKDKIGAFNSPLDESGNPVVLSDGKVLKIDISGSKTAAMDLKVNLLQEHLNVELLMTGYIIESSDNGAEIFYMQDGNSIIEGNNFTYVSFNQQK